MRKFCNGLKNERSTVVNINNGDGFRDIDFGCNFVVLLRFIKLIQIPV
jgi:hypothetical protein